MNLLLLQQNGGQWMYRSSDQEVLVRLARELLQWDLYAFDCWVFDDSNWSMYTRHRQRLITLRGDLSLAHAQVQGDPIALERVLSAHCINVCKTARSGRLQAHAVLQALEGAYPHAKRRHKELGQPSAPASAPPRREDELTAQRLLRQLSCHSDEAGR